MKKKELKKIAEQIAACELALQNPEIDSNSKRAAQDMILNLSSRIEDFDDMTFIDDYVQEILQKF